MLESHTPAIGSAQDILERLERYAAARRVAVANAAHAPSITVGPPGGSHGIDPATADLFPYDLLATIVGCVATVLAGIAFALPVALVFAAALGGSGEWARRNRWFPSAALNLVIGTMVGVVLVLVS